MNYGVESVNQKFYQFYVSMEEVTISMPNIIIFKYLFYKRNQTLNFSTPEL